jgi:hypothetical protein
MDELLNNANLFFKDMNLSFTIRNQVDSLHNNDNNYFLMGKECKIYLSIFTLYWNAVIAKNNSFWTTSTC